MAEEYKIKEGMREQYFDSKIKIHRRNDSIFIIKEK